MQAPVASSVSAAPAAAAVVAKDWWSAIQRVEDLLVGASRFAFSQHSATAADGTGLMPSAGLPWHQLLDASPTLRF